MMAKVTKPSNYMIFTSYYWCTNINSTTVLACPVSLSLSCIRLFWKNLLFVSSHHHSFKKSAFHFVQCMELSRVTECLFLLTLCWKSQKKLPDGGISAESVRNRFRVGGSPTTKVSMWNWVKSQASVPCSVFRSVGVLRAVLSRFF